MSPLAAPFLAAALLLLLAGLLKLRRPAATAQALRTQGLPAATALVRALGGAEVLVAGAALAGTRTGAVGLAVAYAGFTGFVGLALLRGRPLTSCGCFAEPDLPPTWAHPAVTAGLAAAALLAAGTPTGLPQAVAAGAGPALAAAAGALLVAGLALVVLAELPRLVAETAPPPPAQTGPLPFALLPLPTVRS